MTNFIFVDPAPALHATSDDRRFFIVRRGAPRLPVQFDPFVEYYRRRLAARLEARAASYWSGAMGSALCDALQPLAGAQAALFDRDRRAGQVPK